MAFDLEELRDAVAVHGRVARVVIAQVKGSAPREEGAAMLVWRGGQSGTIGGGALELMASEQAFDTQGASQHALGPGLGQCCGGFVTLWFEQFDRDSLPEDGPLFARGKGEMPLSVARILTQARGEGHMPEPQIIEGWMVEPISQPKVPLWIWGAGHVGRALVHTLAPVPEFQITWIDTAPERFPEPPPACVTRLPAAEPERLMPHAPKKAMHLILTYSHALDFALCHAALSHKFAWAGVIGSKTKWARFRKRLQALGWTPDEINSICCPIGQKQLGKAPQAIAIGVAAQLLTQSRKESAHCPNRSSVLRA